MRKELEAKLKDVEAKLPGISEYLKPVRGATWGMHWKSSPQDVKYLETDRYQVVVAKWEEHNWFEDGGGIQWEAWLSVYYKERANNGKIKQKETERIVTRDRTNPSRDRTELWPFNYVGAKPLTEDKIEVAWADEKGNKGLEYTLELK